MGAIRASGGLLLARRDRAPCGPGTVAGALEQHLSWIGSSRVADRPALCEPTKHRKTSPTRHSTTTYKDKSVLRNGSGTCRRRGYNTWNAARYYTFMILYGEVARALPHHTAYVENERERTMLRQQAADITVFSYRGQGSSEFIHDSQYKL